jgi:hypothetical protein
MISTSCFLYCLTKVWLQNDKRVTEKLKSRVNRKRGYICVQNKVEALSFEVNGSANDKRIT